MVTSANDNAMYHLADLEETKVTMPVAGKRIKAFKKRHREEPDPEIEAGSADEDKDEKPDEERINNNSEGEE